MNNIEHLYVEASKIADLKSAEIIDYVFSGIGGKCENCKYPQNAYRYKILLFQYKTAKKESHRFRKKMHRACGRQYTVSMNNWLNEEYNCLKYKDLKDQYRPCGDCIRKYNPHGNKKYGETVSPEYIFNERNFLDYE
jgi:hypothetical protein